MVFRLDVEDRATGLIDGHSARLAAYKGHDGGFVHQPQFALRPVLLRVGVIDDRGIEEHAAVGQDAMKIAGQRAEVSEGITAFVLGEPPLNAVGKRVAVGGVERQFPAGWLARQDHPPRPDEGHGLVDVEPPRAGVVEPERERAGGNHEHPGGDVVLAGPQVAIFRAFEVLLGDAEHEADREAVRDVRRAVQGVEIEEVSRTFGRGRVELDDLFRFLADGINDPAGGLQVVERDCLGDLVHPHHVLALDVHAAGQAEVPIERAGQVVMLDSFCRTDHRIHEDQEVVRAIVLLLMVQEEVHEGLLESDHGNTANEYF